ncbi:amino acid adenylation domain-containing protein [Gordonia sp. CPCC 205515]|uniref:amino acid adenylation domain-containing protein n=1 Tax=Gordonia sp. CPCC 205515 TaxID=3140791 RepID=UPI003AF339AA
MTASKWKEQVIASDDRGPLTGEARFVPLTAAQRGMWFAEQLSPGYSVNIAHYLDLAHEPDGLDHRLLADCLLDASKVLQAPYLRIVDDDGAIGQVIDFDQPDEIRILDFRGQADPFVAAHEWMLAEYRAPVNLLTDSLMVGALLRVSDERTVWYGRGHHIGIDGYAALTQIRMAVERYNAAKTGQTLDEKPVASVVELVEDDQKYQASTRRETDGAHWRSRVADFPERVTLSRRGATAALQPANLVTSAVLEPARQRRLEQLSTDLNSSPAVLMTAAFSAFVARMTGVDDIVLTLPVTGRATAKIKRAGGMLANLLPVRTRETTAGTVRDLIDKVQIELTGALRHQRYRVEDIRRDAGNLDAAAASFGPVVNMMFFDKPIEVVGAEAEYHILSSGILEDMLLNLYQSSPGAPLVIDLHGHPGLYTQDELEQLHARFLVFLGGFLDQRAIDRSVDDIDMFMDSDHALLAALPVPVGPTPNAETSIVDVFAGMVASHGDRPAVTDPHGVTLSYRELDDRSAAVARALRARAVGEGDLVGIATERDVDLVVAILAVLSSGAAYLPLDTGNPSDRLAHIVSDAAPVLVIGTGEKADWLADVPSVTIDELATDAPDGPEPTGPSTSGAPAYVIYTSGSTGRPKGVAVAHRNVTTLIDVAGTEFDFSADDVWTLFHSYAFDFSIWEIFGPLLTGGRCVIVDRSVARAPEEFLELLERESVTVASLTPSAFYLLSETRKRAPRRLALRYLVFGGEELRFDAVARWYDAFGDDVALVNMYGITETTVHVTFRPLTPELVRDQVGSLIGRPLSSLALRVLDRRLRPVPENAVGEIYVAGDQLAQGYLRRPDLTASRFVADPGGRGGRLYRSGDLGRRVGDDIEYLGRADTQVQLRGFRIELGEIETALRAVEGVGTAAALVVEATAGSGAKLVGYITMTDGHEVDPTAVREIVGTRVPGYMVPDVVMVVDELPLTVNGKLDRRALPAPVQRSTGYVAPTSEVEMRLADVVADVLGVTPIGMRDNLFTVGGDSLDAARLASHIRESFRVSIPLAELFESEDFADLARTIEGAAPVTLGPAVAPVAQRPEILPLSPAQTRLWFVNRMDPESPTYNMAGAVALGPDHDPESLRAAFAAVVERHESLRTRYPSVHGEPVQEILSAESVIDQIIAPVRHISADGVDAAIAELSATGFDLIAEVPVRCAVVAAPDENYVVIVLHHICGDGMSLTPLVADLFTAYEAIRAGGRPTWEPLTLQYADYTLWHHDALGDPSDESSLAHREIDFWTTELAGLDDVVELPTDRPRPAMPTGHGAYVDREIDARLVDAVAALAHRNRSSTFHVLHAAVAVLLSRLWGGQDITVGTAVAGRDDPALADIVGMFVNTVVLRTQVRQSDTVDDVVRGSRHTSARALAHAHVPFEQVVEAVAPDRSLTQSPLFEVLMTWQQDRLGAPGADAGVRLLDARVPAAKYDLHVAFTQVQRADGPRIVAEFSYATELFDESTIAAIADQFERLLSAFVAEPTAPIGSIDLLTRDEVRAVTAVHNPATPQTFREVLSAAARLPELSATALSGDTVVTRELFEARTNQIARELIRLNAGAGQVVAIEIGRSTLSIIATVAVIKSGAAFVLIDPTYPSERREMMLESTGARIGLTRAGHAATHRVGMQWLALDDPNLEMQIAGHSGAPIETGELAHPPSLDDLAYLIFTSGSTGRPKATAISNRQVANLAVSSIRRFDVDAAAKVLHVASPSFDVSILELLMALCSGGELVVAGIDEYAGAALTRVIADGGVTHAMMTPSVLATIDPIDVPTLQTVMAAGEACSVELVRRWSDRRFFNAYGPTETTVIVTVDGPMAREDHVTIGSAWDGVGALVLDSALRPAPAGVMGELYLAGDQVGLGYLHQTSLTATRFVANPYGSGRLYRTGDRVTRGRDGRIVYHGRNDFQIKIRGLRIEPGEVDAVIEEHPDVVTCISVGVTVPGGDTLLVTYATTTSGSTIGPDALLAFAAERLPRHMVPHTVMLVDQFELTPVGKIDRKALPPVELAASDDYVAPRSQLESVIAGVFAEVTGRDQVGARDDFFGLGGTSLSAVKVTTRLSEVLDRRISVRELFDAATVSDLAVHLSSAAPGESTPRLRPRKRAELVPVSTIQRGMWLLNQAAPESSAYNVALALRVEGDLDVTAMRVAALDLVVRHESLRTTYPMISGEPTQVIIPPDALDDRLDFRVLTVEGEVTEAIGAITGEGFDVTAQPPVRMAVLRSGPTDHVLVFVVHHICGDGSSMAPMARDLMTAYAARRRGVIPQWTPLRVQYADFTLWQTEKLERVGADGRTEAQAQLDYWRSRLSGAPELITLSADRPRPKAPSYTGGLVEFEVPAELVRALVSVAREMNSTLFMVAHAAFAVLLSRLSGQDDVVIGTPYAGRDDRALDDVVGMFVNTLALRTRVRPEQSFAELLEEVRRDDLADMSNADISFETIASDVLDAPPTSYNPIYQVMFAFQNLEFPEVELDGLRVSQIPEELVSAKVDLQLTLYPGGSPAGSDVEAMRGQFHYATDLFDADTVETLTERLLQVLGAVATDAACIVGDIVIHTSAELADGESDVESDLRLPDLLVLAAQIDPAATAVIRDGFAVTFEQLSATMAAMAVVAPGSDAALTMALMSSVPGLATAGPAGLDEVLGEIRSSAGRLVTNPVTG